MQLSRYLNDNCYFLNAHAALDAASMWMTAQGDEDCVFEVKRKLGSEGWIVCVIHVGELRGFICDTGEF